MERNSNHKNGLLLRSAIKQNSSDVSTRSPVTTSPDFALQWGNCKRLRYTKVQLKDRESNKDSTKGNDPLGSIPVKQTTAKVDRRVVRSDSNKVSNQPDCEINVNGHCVSSYINLRQRSACPAQRILRNSGGSIGMRGQSNGGGRRVGSPATHNNRQNQLQGNNYNSNHNENDNNGSVSSDNKKGGGGGGGGSSSGSDAIRALWPPRFEIGLTNKEKEEDFLAIKGSKLPQRPKKRPKLIQRNLNLVSPGTWLCDLTLDRYEVVEVEKEKKVSKKKRRGLKDMGTMDSDSE